MRVTLFFQPTFVLTFLISTQLISGREFLSSFGLSFRSDESRFDGLEECLFYPEVVLVQDVSTSYENDMKTMKEKIPSLLEYFVDQFDGHAKWGIVTFIDKPVKNLGGDGDFCSVIDMPLTAVNSPGFIDQAQKVFDDLIVGGGGDWLEGASSGMMRAAISSKVGWSSGTHDEATGRPIIRIMIAATDAAVHEAEYHAAAVNASLIPNNLNDRHDEVDKNINVDCAVVDYPRPEDLNAALTRRSIIPIIFAGKPYHMNGDKPIRWGQWVETIKYHNQTGPEGQGWMDMELGLANYYKDYLRDRVQVKGVVEAIETGSGNFVEIFKRAMQQVAEATCLEKTTAAPTASSSIDASHPILTVPSEAPPTDAPSANPSASPTAMPTPPGPESSSTGDAPNKSTTRPSHPDTTSTEAEDGGSHMGIIIGSAAAGAALLAGAVVAAVKFGGLFGSGSSPPAANVGVDVDNVETPPEREQVEDVTADLFN